MMWEHSLSHLKRDNVIMALPSAVEGREDALKLSASSFEHYMYNIFHATLEAQRISSNTFSL